MRRQYMYLGLLVALSVMSRGISAEVIYSNDFGTQEQFDSMVWENVTGGSLAVIREGTMSGPNPPGDLDGDGLYESLAEATSYGRSRGSVHLYAPLYHTMSSIVVSGYGKGTSAQGSGAKWMLSADGTDWDTTALSVTTDDSNSWKQYSVAGGSDPNFVSVSDFWAATQIWSVSGTSNASYWGRTAAMQVEADINPGLPGQRVPVLLNDLGTDEQRGQWLVSGPFEFDPAIGADTNADGLAAGIVVYAPSTAVAMIKITAPAGQAFRNPIATGQGHSPYANSYGQLRLSLDGTNWDAESPIPTPGGWSELIADATGLAQYQAVESFWLQIHMASQNIASDGRFPQVHSVIVTAEMVAGTLPYCGQEGTEYMEADISGPEGVPDCYVDMHDVVFMATQWLDCTEPSCGM